MSLNNKILCLACSSSLPPSKSQYSNLFTTNCCKRPICPSCITSNPRLARYDPCLACLAGVSLLASSSSGSASAINTPSPPIVNLSGEVTDQDTFVLGDDDDDDDEAANFNPRQEIQTSNEIGSAAQNKATEALQPMPTDPPSPQDITSIPAKYYLNRSDTLHGLSLRFGVDMHAICRLNNLPPSIFRNPNLLHTRAFLILPPTAKLPESPVRKEGREAELVRERAVKRLQTLTKEVDWRIAKAYVALADDDHELDARASKFKDASGLLDAHHASSLRPTISDTTLESLAIERYLDDLEWEAAEIKAGRRPGLPKFPFSDFKPQVDKDSCVANVGGGTRNNSAPSRYWPWNLRLNK